MSSAVLPPPGDDALPKGWPQDHGILTLGPEVLAWAEVMLAQPDGMEAGRPWRWRESQARFICWHYALDTDGRWLFRRSQAVLSKGVGKSPMAAGIACCELAGPVVFDGIDADGRPVGRPHPSPWVQLAAVSEDQTENTMSLVINMLNEGEAADAIPGLDVGLTKVRTPHGILQPVTASSTSREGQRTTAAILDETHLWTQANGGRNLAKVIRRNLGKMGGRSIETTNTWQPGTESVAEKTYDYAQAALAGRLRETGGEHVLRWHPQASIDDLSNPHAVKAALDALYGDFPWVDTARVLDEIYDLDTDPQDAMRFYLNQITESSDAWLSDAEVSGCTSDERPADGDVITLGFDGSRGRAKGKPDATALIGCRVADGLLFEVGVWEAPDDDRNAWSDWEPPIPEIEAALADAFDRYTVAALYADPGRDWRSHVNAWEARWGQKVSAAASQAHPFEWWMTGGRSGLVERAVEQLEGAFRNRDVKHTGAHRLVQHLLNARRRISHGKLALGKEHSHSQRKIDAAVAAVLAWQARLDAMSKGAGTEKKRGKIRRIR